jgi:hypothetical protein
MLAGLLAATLGACQAGAPTAAPVAVAPTASATTSAGPSPSPTAPAAVVIEDAGVDAAFAAGTYTSRVFAPRIMFDLPEVAWLRRNATSEATIPLAQPSSDVALTIARVDFVQCGETLLSHPDAAAAANLVGQGPALAGKAVAAARVADRPGHAIDLAGTGAGAAGAIDPANGCILTIGPEPFPAEYGWIVLTSDVRARLTFLDVGGKLILVIGRSTSESLAAVVAATQPVSSSIRFPDDPPGV